MTNDDLRFEQPGDELGDDEYPEEDFDEDEFSSTVPCPHCGAEIYEDAVRCPICENYLESRGSAAFWSGRPWWWIVLGLLGAVAVTIVLAGLTR